MVIKSDDAKTVKHMRLFQMYACKYVYMIIGYQMSSVTILSCDSFLPEIKHNQPYGIIHRIHKWQQWKDGFKKKNRFIKYMK